MSEVETVTRIVELSAIAVAAAFSLRARGESRAEMLSLALAGWLSEELAMAAYGYYGYGDRWLITLHRTPLAVVVVWPVVVLSSLELGRRLRRDRGSGRGLLALSAAGLVVYDTLVLEPVATRLGLWWWKDGSYFGVPVLGVLGWGMFAAAAAVVLDRRPPRALGASAWVSVGRPGVITALTHAMLAAAALPSLALELAIPLSPETYAVGVAALAVALIPVGWRLRRLGVTPTDIGFKIAGSAIFFALIYYERLQPFVWYCSLVPLPYWALTLPNLSARRERETA